MHGSRFCDFKWQLYITESSSPQPRKISVIFGRVYPLAKWILKLGLPCPVMNITRSCGSSKCFSFIRYSKLMIQSAWIISIADVIFWYTLYRVWSVLYYIHLYSFTWYFQLWYWDALNCAKRSNGKTAHQSVCNTRIISTCLLSYKDVTTVETSVRTFQVSWYRSRFLIILRFSILKGRLKQIYKIGRVCLTISYLGVNTPKINVSSSSNSTRRRQIFWWQYSVYRRTICKKCRVFS